MCASCQEQDNFCQEQDKASGTGHILSGTGHSVRNRTFGTPYMMFPDQIFFLVALGALLMSIVAGFFGIIFHILSL